MNAELVVQEVKVWGGIPQTQIHEGDLMITVVTDAADCRWTGRGHNGVIVQAYLQSSNGIHYPIAEKGNPGKSFRMKLPHGVAREEIVREVKDAI